MTERLARGTIAVMDAWARCERGQTAAEYMGVLLIVAAIATALAASGVQHSVAAGVTEQVCDIAGCESDDPPDSGVSPEVSALQLRLDDLATLEGGVFDQLHERARTALASGDLQAAEDAIGQLEFYAGFVAAGPRGRLLEELNGPDAAAFDALVDRRDISVDGGKTSRRFFTVDREPGRGIVAFDFFIPSENSDGFRGDGRPEEGTNVLRSELGIDDSRVMIVIDYETGRAVITQSETNMDGPWGVGGANEPRPISLNDDRGQWDNMGGIDIDETNQIDFSSDADGMHVDWDILNSITPLIISVDGDVDFTEGSDGFLESDDFSNQGKVDRYPQIQVWQYLPDGSEREIARNDYQGGHNPVIGALPHCDLPNLPDLPAIGIGGHNLWDMPDLPDGPSIPGPC